MITQKHKNEFYAERIYKIEETPQEVPQKVLDDEFYHNFGKKNSFARIGNPTILHNTLFGENFLR